MPSASATSEPSERPTMASSTRATMLIRIPSMSAAPRRCRKLARGPDGSAMGLLRLEERETVQLEQPHRDERTREHGGRDAQPLGTHDEQEQRDEDHNEARRVGGERGMNV